MAARSREERQELLLRELRRSRDPVSARVLGELVGISQRTVRDYVAAINRGFAHPVIVSDQRGYRLDQRMLRWVRSQKAADNAEATPRGRLAALIRYLVHDENLDIHELAAHFHVSVPTLESDLARARAIARDQQLVLRRDRDMVFLEGTERAKRRLLRSILFSSDGGSPLEALLNARDRPGSQMARISTALTKGLAESGLELNEFVRGELLIHLTVAVERSRAQTSGKLPDAIPAADNSLAQAAMAIINAVEEQTGVALNAEEHRLLFTLLLANSRTHAVPGAVEPQPEMMELTRDALLALTEQFGIRREDDRHLAPLALHLQHLRERALLGRQLDSPMGSSFKRTHPLLHEMALLFAHALGVRTGLEIGEGEVDYLALHLGAHFQSQLESGPLVSVTLVAPQHGSLTGLLSEKIVSALSGLATIENVVTNLSVDPSEITSDLIITTVTPPSSVSCPCVQISPFGSDADAALIRQAVREERERQRKARLRSTLISLLDEDLFVRISHFDNPDQAIHHGARILQEQGFVEAGFAEDVLERERRYSTTFGTGFAIPHSLYQDAVRTGICVLSVAEPIDWAGSDVSLVFMCAIAPQGMAVFRDALEVLVEVLSPPENVASLIGRADSFEGFAKTMVELLS